MDADADPYAIKDRPDSSVTGPPEDPEEASKDIEDAIRAGTQALTAPVLASIDSATQAVAALQADIDVKMFEPVSLNAAWSSVVSNANEDDSNDGDSTTLDRLAATADKFLARNDSMASKQWNLQQFLATALGLDVPQPALGVTYELLCRYADGTQNTDDVPAPDAMKLALNEAYTSLAAESDAAFWKRLSGAFDKYAAGNPTSADFFYWMQYVQQVFPLKQGFIWSQATVAKSLAVRELVSSQNTTAVDVLANVRTLTGPPLSLPRAVAANCAGLAFMALLANRRSL